MGAQFRDQPQITSAKAKRLRLVAEVANRSRPKRGRQTRTEVELSGHTLLNKSH